MCGSRLCNVMQCLTLPLQQIQRDMKNREQHAEGSAHAFHALNRTFMQRHPLLQVIQPARLTYADQRVDLGLSALNSLRTVASKSVIVPSSLPALARRQAGQHHARDRRILPRQRAVIRPNKKAFMECHARYREVPHGTVQDKIGGIAAKICITSPHLKATPCRRIGTAVHLQSRRGRGGHLQTRQCGRCPGCSRDHRQRIRQISNGIVADSEGQARVAVLPEEQAIVQQLGRKSLLL